MSNRRWFYTDPLAASWMAKHFGMKFVDKAGYSVSADPTMWYMAERHYQAGSLFIHPDSLHQLDPHLGDIGINEVGFTVAFHHGKWWWEIQAMMNEHGQVRIIQRNGVAFHWPEREP